MGLRNEAWEPFVCQRRDRCPHLGGLSTHWVFEEHQRSPWREHEHWRIREQMAAEIEQLSIRTQEQAREIDRLRAENKLLHQRGFKTTRPPKRAVAPAPEAGTPPRRPRGAPLGHPAWNREVPQRIDREVHVEAPLLCPHCQSATSMQECGQSSYVQEDLVEFPRPVITRYVHDTALCPQCRRQVIQPLEGELPFAPIGPKAKAAALYLRHFLKLPYRKINVAMNTLFGLKFVAASTLGFEKRATENAAPIHSDLIDKVRVGKVVHGDETHWREDGRGVWLWYAGTPELAVFRIDARRNSEAALALLGQRLEGLLVADAYAAYNAIDCVGGRQTCLSHILRKAREIGEELALLPEPEESAARFCRKIETLIQEACRVPIPTSAKAREALVAEFKAKLEPICKKPLAYAKAETLRKRFLPDSSEYDRLFVFITSQGPPTNNHAERSLRPLVIFRKVCMGTRSQTGSENVSVFASITQTASLQGADLLNVFEQLFRESPIHAQDAIFGSADPPG